MNAIAPVEKAHCIPIRVPSNINSTTTIIISYTVRDGSRAPVKAHSEVPWKAL